MLAMRKLTVAAVMVLSMLVAVPAAQAAPGDVGHCVDNCRPIELRASLAASNEVRPCQQAIRAQTEGRATLKVGGKPDKADLLVEGQRIPSPLSVAIWLGQPGADESEVLLFVRLVREFELVGDAYGIIARTEIPSGLGNAIATHPELFYVSIISQICAAPSSGAATGPFELFPPTRQ